MAISRGSGTEIIRCASFENVTSTLVKMIIGEQHHIYTVLSIIIQGRTRTGTEKGYLQLFSYDVLGGTTARNIHLGIIEVASGETFVWNDKFSFNGHEPVDFTATLTNDAAGIVKQDAIADQGSGVIQYLALQTDSTNTTYDVVITYIDQNNA